MTNAQLRKIFDDTAYVRTGGAEDVLPCFNPDGLGAVVNSSRGSCIPT